MKILAYSAVLALLLFGFIRIHKQQDRRIIDVAARNAALKKLQFYSIGCSPNLNFFNPQDSVNSIPLLEGWGDYRMPVTVSNDSAKIYFEQGINMYYGFHIIEALASFSKSTKFDSSFAMGYWGMALAYGPNINDFGYSASPDALADMHKAKLLYTKC